MIKLTGYVQCSNQQEVDIVKQYLPEHLRLSQAEEGCLSFSVEKTKNPMIWEVEEIFRNKESFEMHQQRMKGSAWGKATASIKRQYKISENSDH